MKYIKEKLQNKLNVFLHKRFEGVYFSTLEYDNTISFIQLSDQMQNIPYNGIMFHLSDGHFPVIFATDYQPYYNLGGLTLKEDSYISSIRPNHNNDMLWSRYIGVEIMSCSLIESFYIKSDHKIVIPFGVKFTFSNNLSLFIFNAGIEAFKEQENIYELCRGGEELLVIFDEDCIDNYPIIKDNLFYI